MKEEVRKCLKKHVRRYKDYYIYTSKVDVDVPMSDDELHYFVITREAIISAIGGIPVDVIPLRTDRGVHFYINWCSKVKYDDKMLNFIQLLLGDDIVRYDINKRRIARRIPMEYGNILFSSVLARYKSE